MGGRDVEKDQFICALSIVEGRTLHWVSGIAQVQEMGAFDDAAVLDIETGNNSCG